MTTDFESTITACANTIQSLEPELRQEAAARLFLEYCLSGGTNVRLAHLAPLINSVASALTRDIAEVKELNLGVRAVQLYLRTPPIEYFGETLVRHGFLTNQEKDEMLSMKPANVDFGSFLVEQGILTQDQRDMAVISQKRLMSVKEVYSRLLKEEGLEENDQEIMSNLKEIVQHFMVSTAELEESMKSSGGEGYQHTLDRLQNIIAETESSSHNVLGMVDELFDISDDLENLTQKLSGSNESKILEELKETVRKIRNLNIKLNDSQGIQDRTGQQLQKVIPTVKGFHDNLMEVAKRLHLNLENIETEKDFLIKTGYGTEDDKRLGNQNDVDDLLASLGL